MTWNAEDFTRKLASRVKAFDRAGVAALCDELIDRLHQTDEVYPEDQARRVLRQLRHNRYFDLMQRVADCLIQSGQDSAQIRRQYAQSLLDQGNLTAAIHFLHSLVEDTADDAKENGEARGLLGRAYKQIYVDAADHTTSRARTALEQALRWYYGVYESDPANIWHGINTVALLHRADADKVPITSVPKAVEVADRIAHDILRGIEEKWAEGQASMWDSAAAAEASLALKKFDEALEWVGRYVREPAADAFELASTHRQFTEVWLLDVASEPGARILPILRAQLLQRDGSRLDLRAEDLHPGSLDRLSQEHFEKVLGKVRYVSYKSLKTALERSRAVARIEDQPDHGFGTGFLVRGGDLHPSLEGEMLLLTNSHLVSDDPAVKGALRPDETTVTFQVLDGTGTSNEACEVTQVVWTSPPWELDATVLRLSKTFEGVEAFPIAPRLPLADGEQRVYIIGHPRGGTLAFSIQDNMLLDHEAPRIHYRAPTEGGSSGSPVFNQQWKLIGLHHAGRTEMRRLNAKPGTYAANEGMWIRSIIEAIAKDF